MKFEFENEGVRFTVFFTGPASTTAGYSVVARRGRGFARGRVFYTPISPKLLVVPKIRLEFFEPPKWFYRIFGRKRWKDDDGTPMKCFSSFVSPPPELAYWLWGDYSQRFMKALSQLRDGIKPEGYSDLWHYEFCRIAGINPWENPSPQQLVARI